MPDATRSQPRAESSAPEHPTAAADRAHEKRVTELRRRRKRAVRLALQSGGTVPFDMRTLIEDGHSAATIRRVIRPRGER